MSPNLIYVASIIFVLLLSGCYRLERIARLPLQLNENSGMAYLEDTIWLHNDSGDDPILYAYHPRQGVFRELRLLDAKNIDWEDLAVSANQNLFIGDFGNNRNQRQDLCIYKIPNPNSLSTHEWLPEKINFHYPDQKQFPPSLNFRHFDVEAMIAWGDSLYLFTKNRTKPNNGYIKLYRLPQKPGNYEAVLQDSFKIKQGKFRKSITSAAISPDGKTLALLSMGRLRIFKDFEGSNFFQAKYQRNYRLAFTQKEAIVFKTNKDLYLSDERSPLGKARLYQLRLKNKKN